MEQPPSSQSDLDARLNTDGFAMRELVSQYYHVLRDTVHNADTSHDKHKAKELMRLIEEDRETLARMRREGANYQGRQTFLRSSTNQEKIRSLYLELGIAEMLTLGDWKVNRGKEMMASMGVVSLPEIEAMILRFYSEEGLLSTTDPLAVEGRLVHLDLGCGNGQMLEDLRCDDSVYPFDNGRVLLNYWAEVGYADRIYFTLNDLLLNLVQDEYLHDESLIELIDLVSILIARRIYFGRRHGAKQSKEMDVLLELPSNPNLVREILPNLGGYINNLSKLTRVNADAEFILDGHRSVSPGCQSLIEEYFDKPADERVNPADVFVRKYFKPELVSDDKEDPLKAKTRPDLASSITIHPHNIILGDFTSFGNILPELPTFDLVTSFRATSHAEDALYKTLVKQAALRLKPGGIIIEDGKRESYTRYERIDILVALQSELGPEYRVGVVADDRGMKSVLIQRAINKPDGRKVFFGDNHEKQLLKDDCHYFGIEDVPRRFPEEMFRNEIILLLRELFVDAAVTEEVHPEERASAVFQGRMEFRGLHGPLDAALQEMAFGTDQWNNRLREADCTSRAREVFREAVFNALHTHKGGKLAVVEHRRAAVATGAAPLRTGDFRVETFPPRKIHEEPCESRRTFPISSIPRNTDIPDLSDTSLEADRTRLVGSLAELKDLLEGKCPITLHTFDCFTDPMMLDMLENVLGLGNFVETRPINLRHCEHPLAERGRIYLVGGSTKAVYDCGQDYTDQFSYPILERIDRGEPMCVLADCFGAQSMLEAFGKLRKKPFKTVPGALQFGHTPVVFSRKNPCLKYLHGEALTVVMTRGDYSLTTEYQEVDDMEPLAFEARLSANTGEWKSNTQIPPVAFSLMDDAVVTAQNHLEIRLTDARHRRKLRTHLQRYFGTQDDAYYGVRSPQRVYNHNVALMAKNRAGKRTSWLAKDVGPAFIIPVLQRQVDKILTAL